MKPNEIDSIKQQNKEKILPSIPMIMVGMGTCGIGNGAESVFVEFQKQIDNKNIRCTLKQTGCFGFCAQEPVVILYQPQKPLLVYSQIEERDVARIVDGLATVSYTHLDVYKRQL